MRWPVLAVLILLPGCTDEPEPESDPEPEALPDLWQGEDRLLLVDGTGYWHTGAGGPSNVLEAYTIATQPIASPCLFNGEPYFNNMDVSQAIGHLGILNGTTQIEITLSWTEQDSLQDDLAIAFIAGNMTTWYVSGEVPRDTPTLMDVPTAAWPDDPMDRYGYIRIAACLDPDGGGVFAADPTELPSFVGDLTVKIDMLRG